MALPRHGKYDHLYLVHLLGLIGFAYSVMSSVWADVPNLTVLAAVLFVVELFPIKLGRMGFTFSFPALFAMAMVTGYEATAVLSLLVMTVVHVCLQKPVRTLLFNASTRCIALLAAGLALHAQPFFPVSSQFVPFHLSRLVITAIVFTTVSNLLVLYYVRRRSSVRKYVPVVLKASVLDVLVSIVYDGFMIWLANDPKNTGTGYLGTLFFFLPLAGISVVMSLITNLTRAKSGLETLFAVSRSINEQRDLPSVLQQIIEQATRLVHGDCGFLFLVEPDGSLVRKVGTTHSLPLERIPKAEGIVGAVAQTGESLLIHDVKRDHRFLPQETLPDTQSLLVLPIHIDHRVSGVISLGKNETHAFNPDDQKIMSIFATHAAVAMKNAWYIEEREKRLILEERNRIAREIHDGLAQDLAGILFRIEMLNQSDGKCQQPALHDLQEMVRKAVTTVRHSIYSLRPNPYIRIGLVPAIRSRLEEISLQHGIHTELTPAPPNLPLSPEISKAVFQIFSESVQNVLKHAEATRIYVRLEQTARLLTLTIRDNGKGFHFGQAIVNALEKRSFGIENMYNIADQIGASLEFLTAPGKGTVVTLQVPVKEETNHGHPRVAV